jgi:hypothetical protein
MLPKYMSVVLFVIKIYGILRTVREFGCLILRTGRWKWTLSCKMFKRGINLLESFIIIIIINGSTAFSRVFKFSQFLKPTRSR